MPARTVKPSASAWTSRALMLPGATAGPFPAEPIAPQLPALVERPPARGDWIVELKWDGYRVGAWLRDGEPRIWTRNLHDWTTKLSWLQQPLRQLPARAVVLDGEVIAGRGRKDDFELLQARIAKHSGADLAFVVFDLLHLDGVDLLDAPLVARKALLAELLAHPPARLALSTHAHGNAAQAMKVTRAGGYEGIVCKRADEPYRPGRSDQWLKIKHVATEEMAVVGYMRASHMREGAQILLLAKPSAEGWIYAGRVKNLGDADSKAAAKLIGRRGAPEPTVRITAAKAKELATDGARWFAPLFVVEVYSRGSTASRLRSPTFKAFRPDKTPGEL
jgi:bifunctional non-homologous end joining protein LigD